MIEVLADDEKPDQRADYGREQVLAWVEQWQRRLHLQDWEVRVQFVRSPTNQDASISFWWLRKAILFYREDQLIGDGEVTVVHELLHLKFANYQEIRDHLQLRTVESSPVRKAWDAALHWPFENLIEQLARILVELRGGEEVETNELVSVPGVAEGPTVG